MTVASALGALWLSTPAAAVIVTMYHPIPAVESPTATCPVYPGSNGPGPLVVGSDKNIWFGIPTSNVIGQFLPSTGGFSYFCLPQLPSTGAAASSIFIENVYSGGIALGPDKRVWVVGNALDASSKEHQILGRSTVAGVTDEFLIDDTATDQDSTGAGAIVAGPDGNMWFTRQFADQVGRITPDGVITYFSLPSASFPTAIVVGPDSNLWVAEYGTNQIAQVSPSTGAVLQQFNLPNAAIGAVSGPWYLTVGGGAFWYTRFDEFLTQFVIGKMTTAGVFTEYTPPGPSSPTPGTTVSLTPSRGKLVYGPDGNIWVTTAQVTSTSNGNNMPSTTTTTAAVTQLNVSTGVFSVYPTGNANSIFEDIIVGPDNNLWVSDVTGSLDMITQSPTQTKGSLVTVSAGTLNFGTVAAGATSTAQQAAIMHNTTSGDLTIGSVSDPTFTRIDACGSVIPAGTATCTLSFSAAPTSTTGASATVPISDSSGTVIAKVQMLVNGGAAASSSGGGTAPPPGGSSSASSGGGGSLDIATLIALSFLIGWRHVLMRRRST